MKIGLILLLNLLIIIEYSLIARAYTHIHTHTHIKLRTHTSIMSEYEKNEIFIVLSIINVEINLQKNLN
jgi:uncharacterized membrane protein